MADVLSFGAISFAAAQKEDILDKFDDLCNNNGFDKWCSRNGFAIFESKQTYHSNDKAYKPFDYKLIIRTIEDFGEDYKHKDIYIELLMCPLPEFLSKKTVDKIKKWFEFDAVHELTIRDIIEYGNIYPLLGFDKVVIVKNNDDYNAYDDDDDDYDTYDIFDIDVVKEKLDCAATVAETYNSIKRFLLNRPWNLMGKTGWELLDELIKETGPIENIVKRFKDIIKRLKNSAA